MAGLGGRQPSQPGGASATRELLILTGKADPDLGPCMRKGKHGILGTNLFGGRKVAVCGLLSPV